MYSVQYYKRKCDLFNVLRCVMYKVFSNCEHVINCILFDEIFVEFSDFKCIYNRKQVWMMIFVSMSNDKIA